jgi:hypothetical protein
MVPKLLIDIPKKIEIDWIHVVSRKEKKR